VAKAHGNSWEGQRWSSPSYDEPVNRARLRENARIVRTLQQELVAAGQAAIASGRDDAGIVDAAEGRLLGGLVGAFLVLTEELAGDIDQDLPR
jgi:hypothetical protein